MQGADVFVRAVAQAGRPWRHGGAARQRQPPARRPHDTLPPQTGCRRRPRASPRPRPCRCILTTNSSATRHAFAFNFICYLSPFTYVVRVASNTATFTFGLENRINRHAATLIDINAFLGSRRV